VEVVIKKCRELAGEIAVPSDKSISHRSVILAALADGRSRVENFLRAADTLATVRCIRHLGVEVSGENNGLVIEGKGLHGLSEPGDVLDCRNSGTTMRLLTGVLSAQPFYSVLTGDNSLRSRPMGRVVEPLRQMGARIDGRDDGRKAPLCIRGGGLQGIDYRLPVASAQVKSAVLLAGLGAEGVTILREPSPSRDHTERMLKAMGAVLNRSGNTITLQPGGTLSPLDFEVPGDISSAAYWVVAATLIRGAEILIKGVGVNPTRSGLLAVLKSMGAQIVLENLREVSGEPVADLVVSAARLKGTVVQGDVIPTLIDEIPVLAVAMALAEGDSLVSDARELRVKETDRIAAICHNLRLLGAEVEEREDGFWVRGRNRLLGSTVDSYGDHRIAMAMGIAGMVAEGSTTVTGAEAVDISYPAFWETLRRFW